MELEGLLKRHYTTVAFFQGTMMNAVDLERVKVPQVIQARFANLPILIFLSTLFDKTKLHMQNRIGWPSSGCQYLMRKLIESRDTQMVK